LTGFRDELLFLKETSVLRSTSPEKEKAEPSAGNSAPNPKPGG